MRSWMLTALLPSIGDSSLEKDNRGGRTWEQSYAVTECNCRVWTSSTRDRYAILYCGIFCR